MSRLQITDYTVTTALGAGNEANWNALAHGRTGLASCRFSTAAGLETWVGEVGGLNGFFLEGEWQKYDCRNNRLAWLGLAQDSFRQSVADAIDRYGADRVGVFVGTSTSGIHQTELAYCARQCADESLPDWYEYSTTHNTYSITDFVRSVTGCGGVSMSISTACSSSAKVCASAWRAIEAGLCDSAIVGGVDSLCLTTLYGFHSLQLTSADLCRPSDAYRSGISIGEAAGFALLERAGEGGEVGMLGYGEAGDAYHMSSPHPQGDGAVLAMQKALTMAGLQMKDIDYINLHGTGTTANDLAEAIAVSRVFGFETPCSSTKGWTGHTLGAAGIVELIFSTMCIRNGFIPHSLNTREIDPAIKINIVTESCCQPVRHVLSNSFGFGGSNCSLVLGALS